MCYVCLCVCVVGVGDREEEAKKTVLVSTKPIFSFLNIVYYFLYLPGQKVAKQREKSQIL